jgi:transposase
MLAFPHSVRLYVALAPVDMRKQYDGLWAAARDQLGEDPKNGAVFIFTNKDRTRVKLLYWDGTGVWVLAKRLEEGRFSWPEPSEAKARIALTPEALALLVGGIDLRRGSLKPWYERGEK